MMGAKAAVACRRADTYCLTLSDLCLCHRVGTPASPSSVSRRWWPQGGVVETRRRGCAESLVKVGPEIGSVQSRHTAMAKNAANMRLRAITTTSEAVIQLRNTQ